MGKESPDNKTTIAKKTKSQNNRLKPALRSKKRLKFISLAKKDKIEVEVKRNLNVSTMMIIKRLVKVITRSETISQEQKVMKVNIDPKNSTITVVDIRITKVKSRELTLLNQRKIKANNRTTEWLLRSSRKQMLSPPRAMSNLLGVRRALQQLQRIKSKPSNKKEQPMQPRLPTVSAH